jgi:hypothetical protein
MTTADGDGIQLKNWMDLSVQPSPYLVKHVLGEGAFGIIYGAPGSMKSFLAMDLAAHVACGIEWHGHRVKQGPVCYIACEGSDSIGRRLLAWRQFKGLTDEQAANMPFYVIDRTVNFGTKDKDVHDAGKVSNRIKAKEEELGRPFALIVVDTVSQSLAGQNENSPEGMGAFIYLMNKLRETTSAAALGIHHTGKDVNRGARGWSGLLAAVSTEIMVTSDNGLAEFKATKQRDMDKGKCHLFFEDKEVPILDPDSGIELVDEDGEGQTTLVMEATDARPEPKADPIKPEAKVMLQLLWAQIQPTPSAMARPGGPGGPPIEEHWHGIGFSAWRDMCRAVSDQITKGAARSAFNTAFNRGVENLAENGRIGYDDHWVWPIPKIEGLD